MTAEERARYLFDLFEFIEYDSKVKTFIHGKEIMRVDSGSGINEGR